MKIDPYKNKEKYDTSDGFNVRLEARGMKAWLKGGLIGGVISIIILTIISFIEPVFFFLALMGSSISCNFYACTPTFVFLNFPRWPSFIITGLIITMIFAIIGAIIGWIVGKVKSRKQGI